MLSKKENCNKCNKSFTLKTLNKNNGICGRCAKPKSNFKREKISSITREHVWNKTYGNSIKGICNVCRINIISPFNFECGHDIAVSKGGSNDVSNLSAICNKCNKSMGIKTFKEVMGEKKYETKVIYLKNGKEKYYKKEKLTYPPCNCGTILNCRCPYLTKYSSFQ